MNESGQGIDNRFIEIDNRKNNLEVSKRDKSEVEIVSDVGAILTKLEVDGRLVDSVVRYTTPLLPLLGLIGGPPDATREGRGVYHDVTVGDEKAIMYGKGLGNKDLLSGESGK